MTQPTFFGSALRPGLAQSWIKLTAGSLGLDQVGKEANFVVERKILGTVGCSPSDSGPYGCCLSER